jgi:hypothetical protein
MEHYRIHQESVCLTDILRMKYSPRTYLFSSVIMVAMVMHFALTLLYQLPVASELSPAKDLAYRYSVPFFHQTWKLFAPDVPEYDVQLVYSLHLPDGWSEWHDAAGSLHKGNGSVTETLEQSMASGLTWEVTRNVYTENDTVRFERVMRSFAYSRAVYFLHGLSKRLPGAMDADSVKIQLYYLFTPMPGDTCKALFRNVSFPAYPFPKPTQP